MFRCRSELPLPCAPLQISRRRLQLNSPGMDRPYPLFRQKPYAFPRIPDYSASRMRKTLRRRFLRSFRATNHPHPSPDWRGRRTLLRLWRADGMRPSAFRLACVSSGSRSPAIAGRRPPAFGLPGRDAGYDQIRFHHFATGSTSISRAFSTACSTTSRTASAECS